MMKTHAEATTWFGLGVPVRSAEVGEYMSVELAERTVLLPEFYVMAGTDVGLREKVRHIVNRADEALAFAEQGAELVLTSRGVPSQIDGTWFAVVSAAVVGPTRMYVTYNPEGPFVAYTRHRGVRRGLLDRETASA